MEIEYEATFTDIKKEEIRQKLRQAGATLVKQEFTQKRIVFDLPKGNEIEGGWLRIRDEGDKITMSLKVISGDKIEDQKEVCLEVNNFEEAQKMLIAIGCKKKAYQESKRELWTLNNVEVTLDEWPFLEPFVEVEGKSEKEVKEVCEKLGFNYNEALFGAVDTLYNEKYGVSKDIINNHTPEITFSGRNPFLEPQGNETNINKNGEKSTMLTLDQIKQKIEAGLPGAEVEVLDPRRDGVHLKAVVKFAGFQGKTLLEQHRMVYETLREELKEELHALALETKV